VIVRPTAHEIGSKRRFYLLWWGALLEIKTSFQSFNNLTAFEVTNQMPAMQPWKNSC
jgi:hypothetical protein